MELESKKLTCPKCAKVFVVTKDNKAFLPFCSKRCKMIDLGLWMGEKYVVPESTSEDTIKTDKEE